MRKCCVSWPGQRHTSACETEWRSTRDFQEHVCCEHAAAWRRQSREWEARAWIAVGVLVLTALLLVVRLST